MAEGPDGVRSWVVVFSILIINLIVAGILRSQGILFVAFINVFDADRMTAAFPFSVLVILKNLIGPAVGIIGQKYGIPVVIISGAIIGSLGFVLCYFSPDIMWITIFFGGMYGTSIALVRVLLQVVIGQYFVKHRTTACGVAYSGGCIGAFVLPTLLEMLLRYYGLGGTFILLAGMMLHIIPAAMLLKKPQRLANVDQQSICENDLRIIKGVNTSLCDSETFPSMSSSKSSRGDGLCNKGHTTMNIFENKFPICTKRTFNKTHSLARHRHMSFSYYLHSSRDTGNMGITSRNVTPNSEYIFDIDLDYLKSRKEIVCDMFSLKLSNTAQSYRTLLFQIEDDSWHPDNQEVMQEIENIYLHIEKALEMNYISDGTIKINDLHMKRTLLNGKLLLKERLRGTKRDFLPFDERRFQLNKNRFTPNISKIYNDFVRKNYIMSKMRELYNNNELRMIHLLNQYDAKDVQRVLFQLQNMYRLYSDLKFAEDYESSEMYKKPSTSRRIKAKGEVRNWVEVKPTNIEKESKENDRKSTKNTFIHHIKATFKLHMNPTFLLICFSRTVFHLTFATVMTTIVDFTMDNGLDRDDGKYVIGALSFGDLIGRLCLGWITDHGFATLPRYMLVVTILQGLCTMSLPMMDTRWTLLPSICLFGLIHGSLFIQQSILIVKHFESGRQSIAAGCLDFFGGIIGLILPSYIGFFRDKIGSYNPIFYINGSIALFSGLTWLIDPYISKKSWNEVES